MKRLDDILASLATPQPDAEEVEQEGMGPNSALIQYAEALLAVKRPRPKDAVAKHAVKRARRYLADFAEDMKNNFR